MTPDLRMLLPLWVQSRQFGFVRFRVSAQSVDATQALNLSAGVSYSRVLRGRSFS